mmetsp:Transcript_53393/g.105918  ORF Transcript_53393/g.105918 Transcript_53393/m.105918 type:complete len:329 (-) Transcript_53393:328-1314(-)
MLLLRLLSREPRTTNGGTDGGTDDDTDGGKDVIISSSSTSRPHRVSSNSTRFTADAALPWLPTLELLSSATVAYGGPTFAALSATMPPPLTPLSFVEECDEGGRGDGAATFSATGAAPASPCNGNAARASSRATERRSRVMAVCGASKRYEGNGDADDDANGAFAAAAPACGENASMATAATGGRRPAAPLAPPDRDVTRGNAKPPFTLRTTALLLLLSPLLPPPADAADAAAAAGASKVGKEEATTASLRPCTSTLTSCCTNPVTQRKRTAASWACSSTPGCGVCRTKWTSSSREPLRVSHGLAAKAPAPPTPPTLLSPLLLPPPHP